MDIELEKLKKLEHALCDAIDILRDWQVEEVKPEEERFIAYLARPKYRDCYLTACAEDMWEAVQKEFDAKTKLFVGTCDEAVKWYESREKFTEIIKAWEDGKTIQVYETLFKKWSDCAGTPEWYTDCEYRVKPECPCADGIDSKACKGEEMNHIEVDLRTVDGDKTVFVPCPKCGRVLPIRYDSVTKCNCGIEICRSDDLMQSITSEVEL